MVWLVVVVQWLHVLLGILWFGSTLYINLILIPAVLPLPREKQQEIASRVSPLTTRVLRPTAILVIVLGFIRGTFLGQIHSIQDVVGTTYGMTWLVALIGALLLFGFIEVIFDPRANLAKVGQTSCARVRASSGDSIGRLSHLPALCCNVRRLNTAKGDAEYDATLQRVKVFAAFELVGFFAIFTCMILLRFGL